MHTCSPVVAPPSLQSSQVTHVEAAIKQAQKDARDARRSSSNHGTMTGAPPDPAVAQNDARARVDHSNDGGGGGRTGGSVNGDAGGGGGGDAGGPPAIVEVAVKAWSSKRKTPPVPATGTTELSLAAVTTLVNSLSRAPSLSFTHGGMTGGGSGGGGSGGGGGGRKLSRVGRTAADRVLARHTPTRGSVMHSLSGDNAPAPDVDVGVAGGAPYSAVPPCVGGDSLPLLPSSGEEVDGFWSGPR